jgi:hypothetical protein
MAVKYSRYKFRYKFVIVSLQKRFRNGCFRSDTATWIQKWLKIFVRTSSPLAKGDPVLGISGLGPHILAFSTPENAPTEISLGLKKKVGKKKRS